MFRKSYLKIVLSGGVVLVLLVLVAVNPKQTEASLFDDFLSEMNKTLQGGVESVNNLVNPKDKHTNKVLSVDSDITLAEGGDVNVNGQIDAGDTITFIYSIQNNSDKKYAYATLRTNIQRDSLNSIRNVSGVTGIADDGKTLEFPNLRVEPGLSIMISFDATLNFFSEQDPIISTEPELVAEDKKSLLKSGKKQIQGKRIKKEDIPTQVRILKRDK